MIFIYVITYIKYYFMENERLLKIHEAMDYLKVSKATLHRWDKTGKLKATRTPGGHRRYRLSDLENIVSPSTKHYTYASLYEDLCNAQFKADELFKEGLIDEKICKKIMDARETVGQYHLSDMFKKNSWS